MNAARVRDRRHGALLILVAVVLLVLIGFVGLALDTGVAALTLHQIQNASDAAALAACRVLGDPNGVDLGLARDAAVALAEANKTNGVPLELDRNDGNAENGDIVLGRYERLHGTFRATEELPNAVLVNGRRTGGSLTGPLPLLFGPVFGTETVSLDRYAIAMNQSNQVSTPGILVISPHDECALHMRGNDTIQLTAAEGFNASIQVNSDSSRAVCGDGSSVTLIADELNIVGDNPGFDMLDGPGIQCDINPGSPPLPDPLAGLPAPSWGTDQGSITTSGTYTPGYYAGGMNLGGNKTVVLQPGIYVFDGTGVSVGGSVNLTANGVFLYVKGSGKVDLGGNGQVEITPSQDPADTYYHVSLFQARDDVRPAKLIGTSNMNLQGAFYFPKAHVLLGGNGGSLGNLVIAWTLEIQGNAVMNVSYNGDFITVGSFIYLVK